MAVVRHKEAIHSGQFMVSEFEADAQDEEEMNVPTQEEGSQISQLISAAEEVDYEAPKIMTPFTEPEIDLTRSNTRNTQAIIDVSLDKLFQRMTIAYRQKLTSPKWNRFRGLKLRWKDKIRLNNVIWRCWHMQFVKGNSNLLAFANPLEIDNHNLPEGGTLLEGKYWKRKLKAIEQEYSRWRHFFKKSKDPDTNDAISNNDFFNNLQTPFQMLEGTKDDAALLDFELDDFYVDAVFGNFQLDTRRNSTASLVPPLTQTVSRDANKLTTNSDFIQPGIAQLLSNPDDLFMDVDSIDTQNDWQQMSRLSSISELSEDTNTTNASSTSNLLNPIQLNNSQSNSGLSSNSNSNSANAIQTTDLMLSNNKNSNTKQPIINMPISYDIMNTNPVVNNNMMNYPMDLQMQQQTNPDRIVSHTQMNTNVNEPISFTQPTRNGSLDIPMTSNSILKPNNYQFEQQQTGATNNEVDVYPFHLQQNVRKSVNSIPCSTEKRNSPKHRILHQRECLNKEIYRTTSSVLPYEVPASKISHHFNSSHNTNKSDPSLGMSSLGYSNSTVSYLEPRGQPNIPININENTPSDFSTDSLRSSINIHSKRSQPPPVMTNPRSELVQLLKNNSSNNHRPNGGGHHFNLTENISPSLLRSSLISIPPPPSNSAPQPRLDLGLSQEELLKQNQGENNNLIRISPTSSIRGESGNNLSHHSSMGFSDHKRNTHVSSEQKRRGSIKNGFELMRSLIPSLSQNNSVKISKAALLRKGGDYLQQLKNDRDNLSQDIAIYREQVERLNKDLLELQASMASNGNTRLTHDTMEEMEQLFTNHVKHCTSQNWKYWIFSLLIKPLLTSYQSNVKAGSYDEMARTTSNWIDQNLSLVQLRPIFVESMKKLSVSSDILNNPELLPQYAVQIANNITPVSGSSKSISDKKLDKSK